MTDRKFTQHEVMLMKVALSVAILRTKPSGIDIKLFIEQMSIRFGRQERTWKERARYLERELLLKKQELLERDLSSHDVNDSMLREEAPTSIDSETPCSNKLLVVDEPMSEIAVHLKFLKNVCHLRSSTARLSTLSLSTYDLSSTISDTIIRATEVIAGFLPSAVTRGFPSIASFQTSVDIIAGAFDNPLVTRFHQQLGEAAMLLARQILHIIIQFDAFSTEEDVHNVLCAMLLALAKSPVLTRWILAELLASISSHSDYLRDLSTVLDRRQDHFKVVEYENMCHVFRILEEIIMESDITSDQRACHDIRKLLDDSLLYISQPFPVFAHYVWRLGALINTKLQH